MSLTGAPIDPRLKAAALLVASCIGGPAPCYAEPPSVPPAELVQIPVSPLPFSLQGLLRRPAGIAHPPAVVLLPACDQDAKPTDEDWGARISSWGYLTLTIDGFGPRGIKNCGSAAYANAFELVLDPYRSLKFLIQKRFVDAKRTAVVGFGAGASQTLAAVERGATEKSSEHKFRAAAAFYPPCGYFKGIMTVPTLVLIGGRDDRARADACRKMAAGEDDMGISRQKSDGAPVELIVYPDAPFAFGLPGLKTASQHPGSQAAFNQSAADQSSETLREFLHSIMGTGQ
jgi:dienelactone hydrolase